MRRLLFLLASMSVLLLSVSCGGGDDDAAEFEDAELTEGRLPDGWPVDFPAYPGAALQFGLRDNEEGSYIAQWDTEDPVSQVGAFYADRLADGPWASVDTTDAEGELRITFQHASDARGGLVIIGDVEGTTAILVTILDDREATSNERGDARGDGSEGAMDETPVERGPPSEDGLPGEVVLPDTYPAERVPLPADAHVTAAEVRAAGNVASHIVQFYSRNSTNEIAAFFKSQLEGDGFTEQVRTEQAGGLFVSFSDGTGQSSGTTVSVTVTQSDVPGYTTTAIQVTVSS